jgi:hypothetical protein
MWDHHNSEPASGCRSNPYHLTTTSETSSFTKQTQAKTVEQTINGGITHNNNIIRCSEIFWQMVKQIYLKHHAILCGKMYACLFT